MRQASIIQISVAASSVFVWFRIRVGDPLGKILSRNHAFMLSATPGHNQKVDQAQDFIGAFKTLYA